MKRRGAWLVLAACAAYFVWMAREGFGSVLVADDYMNAYFAWVKPWSRLWSSLLTATGNNERALGLLVYRGLFEGFGLDPRVYRAAGMGLIGANLVLAWLLMRDWLGVAGLAAGLFAFSYHALLSDLYLSTGTIFDLLCFGAMAGALLIYRRESQTWKERSTLALLALCAVNAKEIGFTLPAVLLAYELLLGRRRHAWKSLLAVSAPVAWAVALRVWQPNWMGQNSAYQLHLDPGFLLTNLAQYFRQLFFMTRDLSYWELAFILGGTAALAAWLRGAGLFGWIWFWITAAPILTIDSRSLYALYIAYFGACLFVGAVAGRIPGRWVRGAAALAFVALMISRNSYYQEAAQRWYRQLSWEGPVAEESFRRQFPTLPKGAIIYVPDDPYDDGNWLLAFAGQLMYRDKDLMVRRKKQGFARPQGTYGDLIVVRPPVTPRPKD